MFKGLIVPIVLGTLIMAFIKINSLAQLACWIVLYSVVYCINVWILSMNKYERELVAKPIKRLVQKN